MTNPPKKQKVHSLTGRITWPLLLASFKAVKRNRGAAGIDKVSIKMFEANLVENLSALQCQLKDGSFEPKPLRRHLISKGGGKFRPLGIPAVRDRVGQEVLRRLLNPIFEPLFHPASHGFRQGRSCHGALRQALNLHGEGLKTILDADIQGFFDALPQNVIVQAVAAEVADGNILHLIQKFLRAGVMENGVFKPTTVGTPQGGVISPLLANIVLNYLDWQLEAGGYRFVRYADDFIVICQTKTQAKEALTLVQQTLDRLGLRLSPEKTHIATYGKGYSFLGFWLSSRSRRMRPKSVQKFKDKVQSLTVRSHNLDATLLEKLNQVIRGTALYFATPWSTGGKQFKSLDQWIRSRLRAIKFKRRWMTDNRRFRNRDLEKLGLLSLRTFLCTQDTVMR